MLFASRQLGVDVDKQPAMLWLVDAIIACSHMPVGWNRQSAEVSPLMAESGSEQILAKLSSVDRARFVAHGEVPIYMHAMLKVTSEQHPMHKAAKDAERTLNNPLAANRSN